MTHFGERSSSKRSRRMFCRRSRIQRRLYSRVKSPESRSKDHFFEYFHKLITLTEEENVSPRSMKTRYLIAHGEYDKAQGSRPARLPVRSVSQLSGLDRQHL